MEESVLKPQCKRILAKFSSNCPPPRGQGMTKSNRSGIRLVKREVFTQPEKAAHLTTHLFLTGPAITDHRLLDAEGWIFKNR